MFEGVFTQNLRVIENIGNEVLVINIDRLENRLNKVLPKVDRTSNWISAIGIFVALILGVISYACVEEKYRPSLGLTIPLVIVILVSLGFTGYVLFKSYKAISVEEIVEELKKDDARKKDENETQPQHKDKPKEEKNNPPKSIIPQSKQTGIRKKKGKKHRK